MAKAGKCEVCGTDTPELFQCGFVRCRKFCCRRCIEGFFCHQDVEATLCDACSPAHELHGIAHLIAESEIAANSTAWAEVQIQCCPVGVQALAAADPPARQQAIAELAAYARGGVLEMADQEYTQSGDWLVCDKAYRLWRRALKTTRN